MAAPTSPELVESKLEELFLRVEMESEKRAQEVHNASTDMSELGAKHKRRGSVAITRFGQLAEERNDSSQSLSAIAAKSSIYHSPLNNHSSTSLESHHDDSEGTIVEDEHHITHIHQIVPKQSLSRAVGGILAKKSRSRSGSVLSTTGDLGVVIGVSVLEATVESHENEHQLDENSPGVSIVVSGGVESAEEGGGDSLSGRRLKRKSSRLGVLQDKLKSLRDKLWMDRPMSSSSSRPQTSSGRRPGTSSGMFHRHPQYSFSPDQYVEEEEEEEEDSGDEGLFAFVPPSTAEQHERRIRQEFAQHQQHSTDPTSSYPLQVPPQAFDPHARYPADVLNSPTGPSQRTYIPPPTSIRVETPSSGANHGFSPDDPYMLKRIPHSSQDQEVHVSLSPSKDGHDIEKPRSEHTLMTRSSRRRSVCSADQSVTPDDESSVSIKMEFDFDAIEEEDSPYPEVRASVSNIDDPDMPALTVRMWIIGLILTLLSGALNIFFNFRYPTTSVIPIAVLLVSYPVGKVLAFILPITVYRIPLPFTSLSFLASVPLLSRFSHYQYPPALEISFNPGPWNIKEHVLVYIMANVAVNPPYAIQAIVVSEKYYNIEFSYWFSVTLVLATQLTGFGLAGLCRRFLVWPASMVWPQNLVACALLNTLHAEDEEDTGGMSRYRFFIIVITASFFYYFLPGFLFTALSVFSYICWIVPNNVPVNQLFGTWSGLGMGWLTFDWAQIAWIGSPLMVPWWAEVHVFAGFVLFFWILTPILYYTNVWQVAYFPISDNRPYDRFGKPYNVQRVLRNDTETFNSTAYEEYSQLYLPATYVVTYLLAFALSTNVIVHTILYHGRSLLNGIKRIKSEPDDVHAKLMRNYPEVPDWWYACAFVFFFCLAVIAVEVWDAAVPVWSLLLAVLLPVIYILPNGFIYAMTGQGISLNLLAQIIPGTILPGNPVANMIFKVYSVQTLSEATTFVQDLKLGHYVKVPPRATFLAQAVATVLAAFIQCGVKQWMFDKIEDICDPNQSSLLTCPHNTVFFTASAVWGLIGPTRQFGKGTLYHPQLYAIIVGAVLPIPFWFYNRRYPNSWIKSLNTPVILTGVSSIPPATGINYSSWFAVGFVFQYLIRKKNFAWWSKFNYVASAALDSGTALGVIMVFLCLQVPKGGLTLNWWGNTVYEGTADFRKVALLQIPEGGLPFR